MTCKIVYTYAMYMYEIAVVKPVLSHKHFTSQPNMNEHKVMMIFLYQKGKKRVNFRCSNVHR